MISVKNGVISEARIRLQFTIFNFFNVSPSSLKGGSFGYAQYFRKHHSTIPPLG
jgi:hypothetical protein